jgi:predicted alpha/beta-hydrolase family hydrolase
MAAELVTVWLGHGASGGPETMEPYLLGLRSHGIDARSLRLPKGSAERAMPALRKQVGDALPGSVIGGHSFGGRVASMVAAEQAPTALVLLSYPLHRPGHPEELRVDHWPRITCPVLLLSGDRDPFARIDLLRAAVRPLATAELVVYDGERHGLVRRAADVCDRIAEFLAGIARVRQPPG